MQLPPIRPDQSFPDFLDDLTVTTSALVATRVLYKFLIEHPQWLQTDGGDILLHHVQKQGHLLVDVLERSIEDFISRY